MRLEESCRLRTFVNVSTIRWTMSACRSPKIDIVEDGLVLWGDKGTKPVCSVWHRGVMTIYPGFSL